MAKKQQENTYKTEVKILQKQIKNITAFLNKKNDFLNQDFIALTSNKNSNNTLPRLDNNETFDNLLSENRRVFILKMLEDLGITVNGKSCLSERKKGALRGIVDACRENNLLPLLSLDALCTLIADKIKLELNSKLNFSNISYSFQQKANHYIKENFKI